MDNAYAKGKNLLCGGYSEYTPTGKSYFVKAARWFNIPERGDIVYFYYANLGRVGHVGAAVVVSVDHAKRMFTFTTVEGNTSSTDAIRNGGCVAGHTYAASFDNVGGKNKINGFGRPEFGADTCTVEEFICILNDEIGYLEKASDSQLENKTANAGFANYTKYGQWYGDNGAYWCQQFISWCAYEACRQHMEIQKTGWEKQTDGTWKYLINGEYTRNEWVEIATAAGRQWFVFDGAGTMVTGWFGSNDGDWYYMNVADGAMLAAQWFDVNGKWYYATKSGLTAKNTYVKSTKPGVYCWLGDDGSWDESWDTLTPDLVKYGLAE